MTADGLDAPPSLRDHPVDWFLRSRVTGRITVAQWPNWSLATWLVTSLVLRLAHPHGAARTALTVVATGALVVWAVDEVLRGVNPFRRLLGAVVLGSVALRLV